MANISDDERARLLARLATIQAIEDEEARNAARRQAQAEEPVLADIQRAFDAHFAQAGRDRVTQTVAIHVVVKVDVERASRELLDFGAPDITTLLLNEVLSHLASLTYVADVSDIEIIPDVA